jgi:hypothetical protein
LTPCNTSSFLTRSVQLVFCIFLQHHISNLYGLFLIYFPKCLKFRHHTAVLQHPFSSRCTDPCTDRSVNRRYMKRPETPNFGILAMFLVTMRCRKSCYRSLGRDLCFHLQCLLNPGEYKPKIANYRWSVFEHKNHDDRIFYILFILLSHNHVKWTVLWATQVVKIVAAISGRIVGNLTKRHGAISKSPPQIRIPASKYQKLVSYTKLVFTSISTDCRWCSEWTLVRLG